MTKELTSISISKAGGRLALSLYVFLHNASVGPGGGGGGVTSPPTKRPSVSENFAHYIYGNALVEFGVVLGVSMDRTIVMLTYQIRQ